MSARPLDILLITPPLTQLNTPYPATAYLTGFLQHKGFTTHQVDLGLEMVLRIFHRNGLEQLFENISVGPYELSEPHAHMLLQKESYIRTIDAVIAFLQNKQHTIGNRIARRNFLPESFRFEQIQNLSAFFGTMGVQDQARYLSTLYLEDIGDLIQQTVGPNFGFSKYAERIAQTAVSFDPIEQALQQPTDWMDAQLIACLQSHFQAFTPQMVAFTVPFPGNLYGALKCGQWIKQNHPEVKTAMGGGYPNTELRNLQDPRVFDYIDYITLDDGEAPLEALLSHIKSEEANATLKRTYLRQDSKVVFRDDALIHDYPIAKLPCPSYEGLKLESYLSMYDVPNPMHRLWNDGRWNKLTMAHGCYWKKCSFCDISLDYIGRYEPNSARQLVDKMEQMIAQTGETGFHFVDEAAPPMLMRDLAIELIRRDLQVTWWANIRFEKTFSADLCKLLAASGCIAVTGGLEVADERLLALIEKGITIEQVVHVTRAFRDAGILVHAYLMYGFPTQTDEETINSLEIVRQLFQNGLLQSAYWHRFAMTAHSPVGKDPTKYGVVCTGPEFRGFALNDLHHDDPTGADHDKYSDGLIKALYNYMHGKGLDFPLGDFFDFLVPHTDVPSKLISKMLKKQPTDSADLRGYRFVTYNTRCVTSVINKRAHLTIQSGHSEQLFEMPADVAHYWSETWAKIQLPYTEGLSFNEALSDLHQITKQTPQVILSSAWYRSIRQHGLWLLKW
jgi:Radical SAM superfamily